MAPLSIKILKTSTIFDVIWPTFRSRDIFYVIFQSGYLMYDVCKMRVLIGEHVKLFSAHAYVRKSHLNHVTWLSPCWSVVNTIVNGNSREQV